MAAVRRFGCGIGFKVGVHEEEGVFCGGKGEGGIRD